MVAVPAQRNSVDLLRDLEEAGALTETALMLTDPSMSYDRFEALGHFLGKVNRSCAFWIGDWLNFGEQIYGEKVAQAAEATGLAAQTLANRMSVCRHIPPERRRASLAFGVHAEVAYLEPRERDLWLDRAEREQWTRAKLRGEMRAVREVESDGPVGDLAVSGTAVIGGFLGEPEPDHPITCPNCGYDLRSHLSLGE